MEDSPTGTSGTAAAWADIDPKVNPARDGEDAPDACDDAAAVATPGDEDDEGTSPAAAASNDGDDADAKAQDTDNEVRW